MVPKHIGMLATVVCAWPSGDEVGLQIQRDAKVSNSILGACHLYGFLVFSGGGFGLLVGEVSRNWWESGWNMRRLGISQFFYCTPKI